MGLFPFNQYWIQEGEQWHVDDASRNVAKRSNFQKHNLLGD